MSEFYRNKPRYSRLERRFCGIAGLEPRCGYYFFVNGEFTYEDPDTGETHFLETLGFDMFNEVLSGEKTEGVKYIKNIHISARIRSEDLEKLPSIGCFLVRVPCGVNPVDKFGNLELNDGTPQEKLEQVYESEHYEIYEPVIPPRWYLASSLFRNVSNTYGELNLNYTRPISLSRGERIFFLFYTNTIIGNILKHVNEQTGEFFYTTEPLVTSILFDGIFHFDISYVT